MKKTFGNILFYLICAVLLVGVLSQFGVLPFRITYFLTGSMQPSYQPGDLAVLYTGKNMTVAIDDVIFFHANGNPIIHRVKSIENGQIITQGDANNTVDPEKTTVVEGKLLFSVPKLGYLIDYSHIILRDISHLFSPNSS